MELMVKMSEQLNEALAQFRVQVVGAPPPQQQRKELPAGAVRK
jgi:hypothetical protein